MSHEIDEHAAQALGYPPSITDSRPKHGRHTSVRDNVTLVACIVSLISQVGLIAWWGGRIDQRLAINEKGDEKRDALIEQIQRDNARQDSFIASSNAQYTEIMRRLDAIDRKLDAR